MNKSDKNKRAELDKVIKSIADYVDGEYEFSEIAMQTAHYCLFDSISCMLLARKFPACTSMLGAPMPKGDTKVKNGASVITTNYTLDPVNTAFNTSCMIRWLDFNDTWLAAEWGHPSDNFGSILAVCDYMNNAFGKNFTVKDVLKGAIMAYEIQGILALKNSFNRVGLDHVLLVRVASTAVSAKLLGANKEQIVSAICLAFLDGGALRTYRHAPNTGPRKSWAAGDATSRAVRLAIIAMQDGTIYPSVLSAKGWGFQDVLFNSNEIVLERELNDYVMSNILFKISFPAEFHAQTAVECAFKLHPEIKEKFSEIEKIVLHTQESAIRIISKTGPLHNPADRDHCLQYMVAIGLAFGELTANHYEDDVAKNPLIDELREKMHVLEEKRFTKEYLDSDKRSIGNAIQVFFKDGTSTEKVSIDYPIGHRKRREEGIPHLIKKYRSAAVENYKEDDLLKLIEKFSVKDENISDFIQKFNLRV